MESKALVQNQRTNECYLVCRLDKTMWGEKRREWAKQFSPSRHLKYFGDHPAWAGERIRPRGSDKNGGNKKC